MDIVTDVDFESDGLQHGWVTAPCPPGSVDQARLPLSVFRRGEGRTQLFVGGSGHRAGSLALRRLARELELESLSGTVVILPEATASLLGAVARRLADRLDTIVHLADPVAGLGFSPMAACQSDSGGPADEPTEAALFAFGAPESVRFVPAQFAHPVDDYLPPDIAYVRTSLDGGVSCAEAIAIASVGCRNVLSAAGLLETPIELRATRVLGVRHEAALVRTPATGLLELRAGPGRLVYQGDPLALLIDPSGNGLEPLVLRVPRDGVVLAARDDASVKAGDCVAIVAEEMPR